MRPAHCKFPHAQYIDADILDGADAARRLRIINEQDDHSRKLNVFARMRDCRRPLRGAQEAGGAGGRERREIVLEAILGRTFPRSSCESEI